MDKTMCLAFFDFVATEEVRCGCGTHVAIVFLAVYDVATVL